MDQKFISEMAPWVSWAPKFCFGFAVLGTVMASPAILWSLGVTAFLGVFLPNHPFDYIYNFGVRRLTGTDPLPRNSAQRKFACGMATVWLAGAGLAFYGGAMVTGFLLGGSLAAVAGLVSATNICIPSLIYNALFSVDTASEHPEAV
ncbi:MAG: DUF4395 domain-containing protein [Gemmatimonadota bacterium]|nr:DUF4395 domain-containing protein [Gemmatimonadota bacterium]